MPLTWRVTQSPVTSMARAAWAWVASASSSSGGEKRAAKKMASQRAEDERATWRVGGCAVGLGCAGG